jgi:polysaccharide deacetylase 2 family uncharacterized protein YibQ
MAGAVEPGIILPSLLSTCLSIVFLFSASVASLEVSEKPKIAIIIDDLGYKLHEGQQSIGLDHPITLAIIPSSPHAKTLADAAMRKGGKEILVHLPMTPSREIAWEAGLDTSMNEAEFTAMTEKLLSSVPHAVGVNNHGGSLLTQDRERMDWLMVILGENNLFFVDSRTTAESVASEAAKSAHVPFGARDVFLDNKRDIEAIERQLDKLISLANKHGQAIAIGHPYKETLAVLESRLDGIQAQGIEIVGISQVLRDKNDLSDNKTLANSPTGL